MTGQRTGLGADMRSPAGRPQSSDAALLEAIGRRHQAAFGEAYDRHIRAVAWLANALVPPHLVDDVIQATFLTLWDKGGQVKLVGESLLPWLLGVGKQHSRAVLRKEARHPHLEIPEDAPVSEDVEASALNRHLIAAIEEHVSRLGPLDSKIYTLCIRQDMTYEAAARELGVSAPTVRGRLSRLRTSLRRRFDGE